MTTLGLCGPGGSGKDEVAKLLWGKGYQRVAFADPVRRMAEKINPIVDCYGHRYVEVVEMYGYDRAKKDFSEVRELLQRIGMAVREEVSEDVWVMKAVDAVPGGIFHEGDVVFTDVRLDNEVELVRGWGLGEANLIWIERPGVGPVNDHVSENTITKADCDYVISNDGTISELYFNVEKLLWKMNK